MELEPQVSPPRVRRWRIAATAIAAIAVATACTLAVTAWRSADHRAALAEARARALGQELLTKEVELVRCLDGGCARPPRDEDRDRAQLEAARRRLHELQCEQRMAQLQAAFAKDDPVAWILQDVRGDLRAYRTDCTADDPRVEELARRYAEATHETGTALDRRMIQAGIATVRADVAACGARSAATGTVKLHVRVAPDGRPRGVTIGTTPDAGLGACVRDAVAKAHFATTDRGGSFSYPFVF